MVDEEAVGLVLGFAIRAQARADGLGFLAGIDEDEAFASTRVLEEVAEAWIGLLWRDVGSGHDFSAGKRIDAHLVIRVRLMRATAMHYIGFERPKGLDGTLRRLWPGHIEVFHGKTPCAAWFLEPGDDAAPSCAG